MSVQINRRQWLKGSALAAAVTVVRGTAAYPATLFPATDEELIWLDQNENPYGISKKAEKAIMDSIKVANRYPGDSMSTLRDLIAEREGVDKDWIVLGGGSTEIFSLAALLHGADGKGVLLAEPSYFGFQGFVERVRGKMVLVRVGERYEHDLAAMERELSVGIDLTYVCNPNNPTGTIVDSNRLRAFCEEASRYSFVFVDEAYNELVEDARYESMIDLVKKGRNIMVSRTFSKIHGLAGMRVGYGIAKPDIVNEFRRIQTNFAPISALSLAAATASYQDQQYIEFSKTKNLEAKEFFYNLLDRMGKSYIRSHTNFVIYEIDRKAADFVKAMQKHKIYLRPFEFLGKQWIRVSMGTTEEMQKLAAALPNVT